MDVACLLMLGLCDQLERRLQRQDSLLYCRLKYATALVVSLYSFTFLQWAEHHHQQHRHQQQQVFGSSTSLPFLQSPAAVAAAVAVAAAAAARWHLRHYL
jgi:uncharacterized membrane protein